MIYSRSMSEQAREMRRQASVLAGVKSGLRITQAFLLM
jgi:hypothetical protein